MTGLIAIDESGDLGSAGSKYFTISSIVSPSSRQLLPTSRLLPDGKSEKKFHNSNDSDIIRILDSLSSLPIHISYIVTEKNNPDNNIFLYGTDLYKRALTDLIDISLQQLRFKDVNIVVDGSRYIQQNELRNICLELCDSYSKNLKKCYKGVSQNEPCLKLVDYVAGSIRTNFEQNDNTYYSRIQSKISVARRY